MGSVITCCGLCGANCEIIKHAENVRRSHKKSGDNIIMLSDLLYAIRNWKEQLL